MKTVFFVRPDEAEVARRMEKILLSLPKESGILFVGVSVISDPLSVPRKVIYQVAVGCDRARDASLIDALVRTFLRPEVSDDSQLSIQAFRGVDRSSISP